MVYSFKKASYKYIRFRLSDLCKEDYKSLYILTIGVANEMR